MTFTFAHNVNVGTFQEYMKVMGLSGSVHWFTHFVFNVVKIAISMGIITALFKVPFDGTPVLQVCYYHSLVSIII